MDDPAQPGAATQGRRNMTPSHPPIPFSILRPAPPGAKKKACP